MQLTVRFLTVLLFCPLLLLAGEPQPAKKKGKAGAKKAQTPPPNKPPLHPADITTLGEGQTHLDLYLLIGQSNMKGRGTAPEQPANDPRIIMMHLKDDQWYVARHPLHLIGDAKTFAGADNAGVGPGLAFARAMAAADPTARIGLIPCAVGGTPISRWQKGADLYESAVRRAKLAMEQARGVKVRLRGALWLQGEADSGDERVNVYAEKLNALVNSLRADLQLPGLPFVAATIGEFRAEGPDGGKQQINAILLDLPNKCSQTATVDARDIKTHIGDSVHYDTAAQDEIGRRFAAKISQLGSH